MDVYILFSGGIDSTTLIAYYKELGYKIHLLFLEYGQKASTFESKAVNKISIEYGLNVMKIKLKTPKELSGTILGRNSFLIFCAILSEQIEKGIVALGIHAGTSYKDCTPTFIQSIRDSLDAQGLDKVKIDTPFIDMGKNEIWEFAKLKGIPLHLTYSCELGLEQPCGNCPSCKDLKALYEAEN